MTREFWRCFLMFHFVDHCKQCRALEYNFDRSRAQNYFRPQVRFKMASLKAGKLPGHPPLLPLFEVSMVQQETIMLIQQLDTFVPNCTSYFLQASSVGTLQTFAGATQSRLSAALFAALIGSPSQSSGKARIL